MIQFLDTTLRDGEQACGVAISTEKKLEIASCLYQAGITEIEAGIPAAGKRHADLFRAIATQIPGLTAFSWNRLHIADIEASFACGCRHIHVSVPVSERMILRKMGRSKKWLLAEIQRLGKIIVDRGGFFSFGAEDASRTPMEQVLEFYDAAVSAGASRIRYADTVGCQFPQTVKLAIQEIKTTVSLPLDYHAHNDLGLATANALEAYKAGADILSITVNGLGERAGNASLEQLSLILSVLLKEETGINLLRIPDLCQLVAEYSGRPIGTQAPVVGSMVFSHDSGLHVDGCLKDPGVYDLFPPEILGRKTNLFPGVNSGSNALKFFAAGLNTELSDREISGLKDSLFEKWVQGPVTDPMGLFRDCLTTLGEHNDGT